MNHLEVQRNQLATTMQARLLARIMRQAEERRSEDRWKRRLYAMSYGASLRRILTGRV